MRQLTLFALCLVPLVGCFGKIRDDDPPTVVNVNTPNPRPPPPPRSQPPPPPLPDPPVQEGCMAETAIDASSLPWAPPAAPQNGACTSDDVDALQKYVAAGTATSTQQLVDFMSARSKTCSACIFTDANAATWGPVPLVNGDAETVNIGACWALVSGSVECGKAAQNQLDCSYAACSDCATDSDFTQCQQQAAQGLGPCGTENKAFQGRCSAAPATASTTCADLYGSIRVQCVSGP